MTVLQRAYRKYNKKYFRNRLPHGCKVQLDKNLERRETAVGMYLPIDFKPFPCGAILISSRQPSRFRLFTLLHEMCHLKLRDTHWGHGQKFQAEMLRLARAGAFANLW
jgi:hypothetical protein